ncbi:septation protein A [Sulfurivermis fontis]|uniref:septation protein A n=1 Tax=Sulfurivermis fontis TaxID=1972068 RepID=UPI000FDC33B7|nr:septation protein A [Sulfurivermis fontis]
MKLLFDLFPVLLFFLAYKLHDIYVATAVAIVAAFVQVGWFWWRHRRFETMHLVTLGLIAVLGGATLWLHNEEFIKWKPTVVNWLFGAAFLGSRFIGRKTLVERMMGTAIALPAAIWQRLNLAWAGFFLALGGANLYVVYRFDTDTWVNFKLFGMMGLTLAFMVAQAFYLARHVRTEPDSQESD